MARELSPKHTQKNRRYFTFPCLSEKNNFLLSILKNNNFLIKNEAIPIVSIYDNMILF